MTVCTSMQEDQFNHCFQHPTAAVWGRFYTIKAAQRKQVDSNNDLLFVDNYLRITNISN